MASVGAAGVRRFSRLVSHSHPNLWASSSSSRTWNVVVKGQRWNAVGQSQRKGIHQSSVAYKKKSSRESTSAFEDDEDDSPLFGVETGDLFTSEFGATPASTGTEQTSSTTTVATHTEDGKLTPEARLERFNKLLQFVGDRIGSKPVTTVLQVRTTAWQHLCQLATTREQLEQVTEFFPRWRDSKRSFKPQNAEAFVDRCVQLGCPDLALKVFGDHSKYGFDLNSLKAARHLLHALLETPIQDSVTLSALWNIYKLPPISEDLVSCSMLAYVCFKHGSKQSLTVANALVPSLQTLLEKNKPEEWRLGKGHKERAQDIFKQRDWVALTLSTVEENLKAQGVEVDWLSKWREAQRTTIAAPTA
ncbi:hypothetical protein C8Q75DRAFT_888841 [Abortiporus biennis]|nr:hypothetical protein C8Q75DRAFT_888841 [Abortiporus biennis]